MLILVCSNNYFFLIRINPEKLTDIQKRMQAFLAQDQELKEKAQRVSHLLHCNSWGMLVD